MEIHDLLWSRQKLRSGTAKLVTSLFSKASVPVELRSGVLIVFEGIEITSLPLGSNTVVIAEGGKTLLVKHFDRVVRLSFKSKAERNEWRDAIQAQMEENKNQMKKLQDFDVLLKLGEGGMGKVFLVRDMHTGEKYAMKVIMKSGESTSLQRSIDERKLLENFSHPFIIGLKYAFQTERNFYLLTEFAEAGDLLQFMKRRGYKLEASVVKSILSELILALEVVHKSGAIYRDLKPDNVLLGGSGHVKLADFGLAKQLEKGRNGRALSFCGTTKFMAPEVYRHRGYGQSVDIWSLGILMYTMFEGNPPFEMEATREAIEKRILPFSDSTPQAAIDTIYSLLAYNGAERPQIEEVKNLPFFGDVDFEKVMQNASSTSKLFSAKESEKLRKGEVLQSKPSTAPEVSILTKDSSKGLLKKLVGRKSSRDLVVGYSFVSSSGSSA